MKLIALCQRRYYAKPLLTKLLRIMRLTAILVFMASLQLTAKSYSQTVTWSGTAVSLEKLFGDLEKQTGYVFFFNYDLLKDSRSVTLQVNHAPFKDVLKIIFKDQPFDYLIKKKTIFITRKSDLADLQSVNNTNDPPPVEVTGRVVDEKGSPVGGATITVEGTQIAVAATGAGEFSIAVPEDKRVLLISSVGYEDVKVVIPASHIVHVLLRVKASNIEDVVYIGYGTVKKSDLTGSVGSVSKKDLGDRQALDVPTLLSGKVAGVDVTQGSIHIRGVTSFNNTDPIYIIDGFKGGNLATINPSDIENIEVLKDASSTAIYGAEGANGVILVTTRSGRPGPLKISLNAFTGYSSTPRKISVLNASQYVDYAIDGLTNAGQAVLPKLLTPGVRQDITNWQDAVFKTGLRHEVDLSLSSGTDKSSFLLSLGYRYNGAITVQGPANSDFYLRNKNDFKIKKWLRFGDNLALNYSKNNGTAPQANWLIEGIPYIPVYDSTNTAGLGFGDTNTQTDGSGAGNPVSQAYNYHSYGAALNFQANLWAEIEPVKGLVYRFQGGISGNFSRQVSWNPQYTNGGGVGNNTSSLVDQSGYAYLPLIENYLTYSHQFNKHDVSLMLGNSVVDYGENGNLGIYGTSFANFTVKNVFYANANGVQQENYNKSASLSYFGRFNYQYDNKYLLSVNFRADGSPNFAPSNRWGYFPSVAVAWKLHEEKFIKSLHLFDELKLRAGWGESGNDQIGNFAYLEKVWNTNVYYLLGPNDTRVNGATVIANASGDIKWESTVSKSVGTDMAFLHNRLAATAEYFIKNTNDILFGVPRPPSLGYGSNSVSGNAIVNAASCVNKGFELTVGFRGTIGELRYSVNANYTHVTNKVLSLGLGQPYVNNVGDAVGSVSRTDVGNPIGYFWGYVTNGIFKTQKDLDAANTAAQAKGFSYYQDATTRPGDLRFEDVNGDGHVDDNDRTKTGSPIPTSYYGLLTTFEFRGFDLNAQLQGIAGGNVLYGYYSRDASGTFLSNQESEVLNRWKSESDPGNGIQPRAIIGDPAQNARPSSLFVSKSNYLKIRLLSVGYSLPKRIAANSGVESLRIYCSLENFFTFTKYKRGYDPEVGGFNSGNGGDNLERGVDNPSLIPNPKTIVFGIQVGL